MFLWAWNCTTPDTKINKFWELVKEYYPLDKEFEPSDKPLFGIPEIQDSLVEFIHAEEEMEERDPVYEAAIKKEEDGLEMTLTRVRKGRKNAKSKQRSKKRATEKGAWLAGKKPVVENSDDDFQ